VQTQGRIVKGEELMWTVDRTRTRGGRHTGDELEVMTGRHQVQPPIDMGTQYRRINSVIFSKTRSP